MTRMPKKERIQAAFKAVALLFDAHFKHGRFGSRLSSWIVEEQDRREGPLVEALRAIADESFLSEARRRADKALKAWEALDAKPAPRLAELVKAADERAHSMRDKPGQMYAAVLLEDWLAVKAAVEREEKK